jgi:hypothetical protein
MKKKNKNKNLTLILILILLISVGYAALASNLKINGSSQLTAANWDVYWDNVQITEGSVPADNDHKARITDSSKTQVEFSIELNEPGDYYEFTVDAVNNGTIDAMIAANGIVDGVYSDSNYTTPAELPKSVSYTVTYANGKPIQEKHLLEKKNGSTPTIETYKVRIEYRNDEEINPSDLNRENIRTFYFKFGINYVQADSTAIQRLKKLYTVYGNVQVGQPISQDVTVYQTPELAFSASRVYLKHIEEDGVITSSYVEFVVTNEMAQNNPGMIAGTYSLDPKASYADRVDFIKTIFDYENHPERCNEDTDIPYFSCNVNWLFVESRDDEVNAVSSGVECWAGDDYYPNYCYVTEM